MPSYVEAYPNENLTTVMPEQYRYTLPVKAGEQRLLGELTGAACATLVAEIAERHAGPVVLIAPDMQNALRLHDEISQFTDQMVMNLADWETLPYDSFSPHQDIISSRLSTLYQLPTMQRGVLIVPVNTLMQRVCPHSFLHGHALVMKKGQRLSRDALRTQLDSAGYRHVDQVMEHGEYATRGALLDLFPMGSELPYRLDFFDDEIDSLRVFDVDSQRTLEEVEAINLLPAHEFPTDKAAIELFRSQWRDTFEVKRDPEHIYQQVSKGTLPAGIEYWQPLFFSEPLPPLFSYFPANTLLVNTGDLETSAERFQADTLARFENRGVDPMRPLLPPQSLWLRVDELFSELKNWPRMQLKTEHLPTKAANANLGFQKLPDLAIQAQQKAPLDALRKFLETFDGPVVFSVESEGRREALGELLARIKIAPQRIMRLDEASDRGRYLMIGAAEHGFVDTVRNLALICESDLLGERVARRRQDSRRAINPDTLIRNLAELHIGQPVVHLEHGVGRYAGMTTLEAGGITGEYLMLTYANDAKLYVPVSSLHLISRYAGGAEENAPLHKLGGDAWSRARQKAAEKVRDVAAELLDIYAQRAAKEGFAFKHDREQYQLFCDSFPFETTPDQAQAINAVLSDMCQPLAMDRLVCGDVGFGKTEVAMRAAFLAVDNHKQVAVLVPTTLLAQQHYDNFRDRFANWPVRIEMISRFRSAKEQTQILAEVAEGKIDILIGTQMVSKGLDFDHVSIVGILNADTMLNYPDFRSYERAFQLMAQVAGRAGRKNKRGRVILQTKSIDHPIIHQVIANDYEDMVGGQLAERQMFHYPPYYRLVYVYLKNHNESLLDQMAAVMAGKLRAVFGNRVLGPDKPPVARIQTLFIKKIVVKIEQNAPMGRARELLLRIQREMIEDERYKSLIVYYDVDPM